MRGMADITLHGVDSRWPSGTSVKVYPANSLSPNGVSDPTGSAVATVATSGGDLALTGLVADKPYVAWALGKAIRFSISAFVAGTTWKAKVAARRAAMGTS